MSESNHQNRNKPGKGPQERSQLKVFFIWIALFAAAILVWYQADPVESNRIHIEDLKDQSAQGLVKSGKIQSGKIQAGGEPNYYIVTGTIRREDPAAPEGYTLARFQSDGLLDTEDLNFLTGSRLFEYEKQNSLLPVLGGLIPFILVFAILYFLFVRQLRMAGRGALNFGKSKAKLLTREKDKVTFANVAGCDEAKEEVSEVIDFLRDPKKFQRMGGRIPKGILMVGPPGTGKTLLAKAVAGEAEVPFFSISGSDFVEMFVGVGASRVRDMFEQGRKNAPCIIFIDEIDAVGRQRGAGLGGGNDEREQTLNSLLVEMDGFDTTEGVIILASTNRPDILDSALLRPGRFDRQVTIDLPDYKGREEILRVHAKKIKLGEDADLKAVAGVTPGFSGADLANLLNEAALTAARKNKNQVERIDIDEARDKISFGRERRRLMDDEDKRSTAFHEAGHALVRALLEDKNYKLHKVTILPRGQALGMAMFTPIKDILGMTLNQLRNMITVAMAGRIAEEIEIGDFSSGAAADIKQATKIARRMVCDLGMSDLGPVAYGDNQEHLFLGREINKTQNYSEVTATRIDEAISKLINGEYERAKELITEHRSALEGIAEALLKFETIEGKHVDEIIKYGEIRSPVVSSKTEFDLAEKTAAESKKKKKSSTKEDLPPSVDGAQAMA